MSSERPSIALVTGAGSGIGRATARALAAAGHVVVLAGRRRDALDATAADCPGAVPFVADVTDEHAVGALFAGIADRFGRLDLLFNNAGITMPPTDLDAVSPDQWRGVIDTNLTGAFLCTQAAFRLMKRQMPRGGRIINNGSVASMAPRPRAAAYTAAKHALTGLTKATALDGRAFDIACGQIDIGNAATVMASDQMTGAEQADGTIRSEPVIDVALVAQAVAQMAALPLHANIQFMTLMATKMPLIGRG